MGGVIKLPAYFKDHYYRSADDRLDLYARIYGNADGVPILMMHGLTRNSADFENIAKFLYPEFSLIIPEQRGRGRSEYDTDPANDRPEIYAADMFALLESLAIQKIVLLGKSMGGLIAMLMAASQPDIAEALILNDIGPEVEPAGLARLQQYVGEPVQVNNWQDAADYCQKTNAIAFPDYGAEDWMAFAHRTFVVDDSAVPKLAYDMAISEGVQGDEPSAAPADLWPVWDSLSHFPILVIRGEKSDILSPATLRKMKARHGGNLGVSEIPGRGHAPMLDEPEASAAILTFLRNYPK